MKQKERFGFCIGWTCYFELLSPIQGLIGPAGRWKLHTRFKPPHWLWPLMAWKGLVLVLSLDLVDRIQHACCSFLLTAKPLGNWVRFMSFNSALQFNGEFKLGPLWPSNLGFSLLPLVGLAFFPWLGSYMDGLKVKPLLIDQIDPNIIRLDPRLDLCWCGLLLLHWTTPIGKDSWSWCELHVVCFYFCFNSFTWIASLSSCTCLFVEYL